MRFLLNPDPAGTSAGGAGSPVAPNAGVPVQTPTATTPATPAPVVAPPPAVPMVSLPQDQYQRFLEQERAAISARDEADRKAREAEAKALKAAVGEGEAKTRLEEFTTTAQKREFALEQEIRDTRASVAVAEAMAGTAFADEDAREQSRMLLAARVVVEKDGSGRYVALDRETRRPASEILRAEITGPRFARFRAAAHQGGSGMGQGQGSGHGGSPQGGPQPVIQGGDEAAARRMRFANEMMTAEAGGFGFNSGVYPGAGNTSGGIGGFGGRQPTNRN